MPEEIKIEPSFSRLYADIFNNAPIGIYTINKQGIVDSFNPKMLLMAGAKSYNQVIGLNVLKLPSYKKAGLTKYLKEGLLGKPFSTDSVEYVSDTAGKKSTRRYKGIPIRGENGEVERLLLLVEDITEEREALQEAKESEERLRVIFENANDGIFTLSPKGFFTSVNTKAQKMTGYSFEEVKGKHFAAAGVVASKDIPKVLKEFAKRIAGILSEPYEATLVRKDGSLLEVEINSAFMKKDGRIVETMGIIRDITERKRVEQMRLDFVAMASHQLLEPLSVVRDAISAVISGETGDIGGEANMYLTQALERIESQILLVSNFLRVSNIEAGKMTFEVTPIKLRELLQKAVNEYKISSERKGLSLLEEIPESLPEVSADPTKLAVILDNLLSNAIKYTKKGGIKITVKKEGNNVTVYVADTGLGIAKDDQNLLFEKFYRVHGDIRGTGLGLYLCRMLAEKMGCRIWLSGSHEGQGATFAISVPIHP